MTRPEKSEDSMWCLDHVRNAGSGPDVVRAVLTATLIKVEAASANFGRMHWSPTCA